MKPIQKTKILLQFPLPERVYEKAKKDLRQLDKLTIYKALENDLCTTQNFVTHRINKLEYYDIWNKSS